MTRLEYLTAYLAARMNDAQPRYWDKIIQAGIRQWDEQNKAPANEIPMNKFIYNTGYTSKSKFMQRKHYSK